MLNTIPVPAGSNLTNYILTNGRKHGQTKGLSSPSSQTCPLPRTGCGNLNFNATYNFNEITKTDGHFRHQLPRILTEEFPGVLAILQIQSVGYPTNTFFVYEQVYDAEGNPIEGCMSTGMGMEK